MTEPAGRQVSLGLAPMGDVHGVADGRPAARFPWFEPAARVAALAATLAARDAAAAGRPTAARAAAGVAVAAEPLRAAARGRRDAWL